MGPNGVVLTSQVGSQRIDLQIPDEIFQFNLLNNGAQRVTAQRDFINEWIYFTYSPSTATDTFPSKTLLYNYRDQSWGIFDESYTTYGQFRKTTGEVWDDLTYFTWDEWTDPWNPDPTMVFGTIKNCFAACIVSGAQDIGGLLGFGSSNDVTACFWDIETSGQMTSAGGIGKTTAEMQTKSTFTDAGWDFVEETDHGTENIWWINEGQDYPRLWWELGDETSP